jgi:hypothetical protein
MPPAPFVILPTVFTGLARAATAKPVSIAAAIGLPFAAGVLARQAATSER